MIGRSLAFGSLLGTMAQTPDRTTGVQLCALVMSGGDAECLLQALGDSHSPETREEDHRVLVREARQP